MKKSLAAFALAFVAVLGAVSFSRAVTLKGSENTRAMTQAITAICPGATAVGAAGGGSDVAEQAMLSGAQEVAPMSRFVQALNTCASSHPERAEGRLFAHAAVTVAADAETASACGAELAFSGSFPVAEKNGTPNLQCPGCVSGSYTFSDWRDVLRVLFTGMHHNAGSDLSLQDCNSDVRHSLVAAFPSAFRTGCSASGCARLTHLFRRDDLAGATDTWLTLLGVSGGTGSQHPFCNGTDLEDKDPVRVACTPAKAALTAAAEDVCQKDGTLGLVLPITQPEAAAPAIEFNLAVCEDGKFSFFPPPLDQDHCPNGNLPQAGKCLTPVTSSGQPCLAEYFQTPPVGPNVDARVYNTTVRNNNGTIVLDAAGRQMTSAYYRVHSRHVMPATASNPAGTPCVQASARLQIGCLSQASPCSLGTSDLGSVQTGVSPLSVNGVAPTLASVRKLQQNPVPADVYPAAMNLYFSTLEGSDFIVDHAQSSLLGCFSDQTRVETAAASAGLVSLGVPPVCVDFDERQCGAVMNVNACHGAFNICPQISGYAVSPLSVPVGSLIGVSVSATDPDDASLDYLWSATAGTFANPAAASTTYRCTVAGPQVLSITAWDGGCGDTVQINITCT